MSMTLDGLQGLVSQGENTRVDFKQEVSDQVLSGLPTDIAALANTQGGLIVFGVTDRKEPVGCLLQGKERERISQQARNCRPSVAIDFEEIPFGARRFLVVHIPVSTVVHSDHERRFPVRIGDTTDYLDALGLVMLLQQRGLLREQAPERAFAQAEQKRQAIPEAEASLLEKHLQSPNPIVRIEALRDLPILIHRVVLFERLPIAKAVEKVLKSETSSGEERLLAFQVMRSVVLSGTPREREAVAQWRDYVAEIGSNLAVSPDIARTAYEILEYARDQRAIDLLVRWVKDTDDEKYSALRADNLLANIKFHGLFVPALSAMYGLLEEQPDGRTAKRISGVLDALRRSYG